MKCSTCAGEMGGDYCQHCGQYFKPKRVTFKTILEDLFDSTFSLERSLLKNLKVALTQPQLLPTHYWAGYRRYYFSPGRFFTIASLFLLLHYSVSKEFLGLSITSNIASQLVILISNVLLLSLSSFVLYFPFKKNFFEHLILSIYNTSVWVIVFVPISILLDFALDYNRKEQYFFVVLHLCIAYWNARAFEMRVGRRLLLVLLNLAMIYGMLWFLARQFAAA